MDIFYFYTVYPMKTNAFPSIGDLDFFPVTTLFHAATQLQKTEKVVRICNAGSLWESIHE